MLALTASNTHIFPTMFGPKSVRLRVPDACAFRVKNRGRTMRSNYCCCAHVCSMALIWCGYTTILAKAWLLAPATITTPSRAHASVFGASEFTPFSAGGCVWTPLPANNNAVLGSEPFQTGDRPVRGRAFGMLRMASPGEGVAAAVEGKEQEEPLWLGIDLSTQSVTGAVLRGSGRGGASNDPVVLESINFEV